MPVATNTVELKGSAEVIVKYMEVAISSILQERGVYPHHLFKPRQRFTIKVYLLESVQGEDIKAGLESLKDGIARGQVKEVSLSIKSVETNEAVEHWHFKIDPKRSSLGSKQNQRKVVKEGIVRVMRQILEFVKTMPDLDVYAYSSLSYEDDETMQMPAGWQLGVLDVIPNSRRRGLNAFVTDSHEVQTQAEYIEAQEEEAEEEAVPRYMHIVDPDSDASDHGSQSSQLSQLSQLSMSIHSSPDSA